MRPVIRIIIIFSYSFYWFKDSYECNIEGTVHPDQRRVKGGPALEPGLQRVPEGEHLVSALAHGTTLL